MKKKEGENRIVLAIGLLVGLFALSGANDKNDEYGIKRNRKIVIEKSEP